MPSYPLCMEIKVGGYFILGVESLMSQTAIVAGGCFWGMESRFQKLPGILDTEVGFTGGNFDEPTYRQVCQDITGHVEAVKLEFDPTVISYEEVLDDFFNFHDPTLCRDNCMSQSSHRC